MSVFAGSMGKSYRGTEWAAFVTCSPVVLTRRGLCQATFWVLWWDGAIEIFLLPYCSWFRLNGVFFFFFFYPSFHCHVVEDVCWSCGHLVSSSQHKAAGTWSQHHIRRNPQHAMITKWISCYFQLLTRCLFLLEVWKRRSFMSNFLTWTCPVQRFITVCGIWDMQCCPCERSHSVKFS